MSSVSESVSQLPIADFWPAPGAAGTPGGGTSVPPVDAKALLQRVPNWPLVAASLVVLLGVAGAYGEVAGIEFSIKNSTFGMVTLLAAIGMVGISAAGLKWLWFVGCYGLVLLGSVMAFFDSNSLFSQVSRGRQAAESVGGTMNQLAPGMGQYAEQAAQQASATQFLTMTFYLLILAVVFCGYWALAGRYQERGSATH